MARAARAAWAEACAALERAERFEAAWDRIHAALGLFAPDGQLNDRARATAAIAAALVDLPGPDWSKVRNFVNDARSLSFLDRMHRRLESAEPRPEWREAMAWRWWLRHHRPTPSHPLIARAQAVARDRPLTGEEEASYARVAAVLKSTVRASSAVECMNSVLRMQQSRHRRMTQPMLDLKRLYWNCRPFRSGPARTPVPTRRWAWSCPPTTSGHCFSPIPKSWRKNCQLQEIRNETVPGRQPRGRRRSGLPRPFRPQEFGVPPPNPGVSPRAVSLRPFRPKNCG